MRRIWPCSDEEERDSCNWALKSALDSVPKEYVHTSSVEGEGCLCSGAQPPFKVVRCLLRHALLRTLRGSFFSIPRGRFPMKYQIGQLQTFSIAASPLQTLKIIWGPIILAHPD